MPRRSREPRPQAPQRPMAELLTEKHVGVFAGEFRKPMRDSIHEFQLANGVQGAAATASKYGSEQLNTPPYDNQDRYVISNDLVAVIDGIGGGKHGAAAAQLIAESVLRLTSGRSIDQAVRSSVEEMTQNTGSFNESSGACIAAVRLLDATPTGRFIEVFSLGDCRVIILDAAGKIFFETDDDTQVAERVASGQLAQSEALVSAERHLLTAAASKNLLPNNPRESSMQFVSTGGRVILVSDGVMDNFSTAELVREVYGKAASAAIAYIDQLIERRITWLNALSVNQRQAGLGDAQIRSRLLEEQWEPADPDTNKPENCFADGFEALPKSDDRTMIILDF